MENKTELKELTAAEIKEKELYDKVKVKNYEGFESFLEMSFEKVKVNPGFLDDSFRYIYESRIKDLYNPIEERYMLLGAIASGIYGFDLELISLMSKTFGAFRTVYILENALSGKPEADYYKQLYKVYVESKESLATIIKEGIVELGQWLEQQASKIKMEDLQKLAKEFSEQAEKFKKV